MFHHIPRYFLTKLLYKKRSLRSRSHKAHLPFQDIEKLWKFIQTGMTHEFSDSGDTWIVFYSPCFLFFGLLLDLHGTEFIHPESLIMKANTFLFIDQRTRRGQLDQDTQDQHHRR